MPASTKQLISFGTSRAWLLRLSQCSAGGRVRWARDSEKPAGRKEDEDRCCAHWVAMGEKHVPDGPRASSAERNVLGFAATPDPAQNFHLVSPQAAREAQPDRHLPAVRIIGLDQQGGFWEVEWKIPLDFKWGGTVAVGVSSSRPGVVDCGVEGAHLI